MGEYYESIDRLIYNNPLLFEGLKDDARVKFLEWLPDNTHIVKSFGKYALQLKENGHREYYSAYAIRERLRWDSMLSETGTEYKISNNMTPFIARLIMKMDHRLDGMFKTKGVNYENLITSSIDSNLHLD